ncbi:histidine kinase [bacterium]|nr:histidine kinase [bacterium]
MKIVFKQQNLYWISQVYGWLIYVVLMGLLNQLNGAELNRQLIFNLLVTFSLGVLISHIYRELILKLNWLKYQLYKLIPRILVACLVFGTLFFTVHTIISDVLIAGERYIFEWIDVIRNVINQTVIFLLWSSLYFLFHFVQNYRKEEIKNLKWQAARNEIELNKIKSQLNPHFIFNSMNSIRALVGEDPEKAKDSITRLSNILRSSFMLGKQEVIGFKDEMQLVQDYLILEKTRFEERLAVEYSIDENTYDWPVPPLMVQTLVENGIKHGISKLRDGGSISISSKIENDLLKIRILNSGLYDEQLISETAFGLENTKQRLYLLFGKQAHFSIFNNSKNEVEVQLHIPHHVIQFDYDESNNN